MEFRVLSPTAILGYGFPEESFKAGIKRKPHLIAVDAGSTDPGPFYLGSGKSFTNRAFVKRDLRYMLKAGRKQKVPVIIGTGGGSGARPHVEWCRKIIDEIAREEKLSFKMTVIYADIPPHLVQKALKEGRTESLACVPPLTKKDIDSSTHIVAQMGTGPIEAALEDGAEVVLCGRCYDPAVFAALPIMKGFDPALALHMGKILECAAIAADPGSGADCALGTLTEDSFILEPLSEKRKFTKTSAAAHTLYEKSDPYHLPGPGGALDLTGCSFKEIGQGRVEVKGTRFVSTESHMIKIEGAKRIGYRSISIAGTRDPIMISKIDSILETVKLQVTEMMKREKNSGKTLFHIYGKDGVMGGLEPVKKTSSHELGIVIEAIADTPEMAATLCSITRSTLLHYGYPGRISTAGNLAFLFSPSDIECGEVYEFSIYHLMDTKGKNLFPHKTFFVKG